MTTLELIVLLFAAIPAALTAINLPFLRTPPPANVRPFLSVLVPARNEEKNIAAICASVLASRDVDLELLVLDDGSTDATRTILGAIADTRLRVLGGEPLPAGWSGKQHACAALAREARAPLLVFVDADVRLAPDALSRLAGYMERRPAIGLASGFPRQVTRSWSEILLLPLIHFLLLGFLPLPLAALLPAPALGAGCGQLFIARAEAYVRAGGHAAIRASRHDGLKLPRAFRTAGIGTGLFDATRLCSCRMYDRASLLWEGLTKNATEGMATPVALPIWTALLGLGQVLPLPLAVLDPTPVTLVAAALSFATRFVLALRFRQSLVGVLLHPLSVLALLAVQWTSLLRELRGQPSTWRGRAYPAG